MSQEIISQLSVYQILYTTQITQKIKKWNDGTLKYYKFNNKSEIYNDGGILVGSSFLKNDKLLEEASWGEEFKAGGLLISIDSLLSQSSRDISKAFKKSDSKTPISIKTIQHQIEKKNQNEVAATPIPRRLKIGLSRSTPKSQTKVQSPAVLPTPSVQKSPKIITRRCPPKPMTSDNFMKSETKACVIKDSLDNNSTSGFSVSFLRKKIEPCRESVGASDQVIEESSKVLKDASHKTNLAQNPVFYSSCAIIKEEKPEFELELEREKLIPDSQDGPRVSWDDGINEAELIANLQPLDSNSKLDEDYHQNQNETENHKKSSPCIRKIRRVTGRRKREVLEIKTPFD